MKNQKNSTYILIVIIVSFGVYLLDLTCGFVVDDRHLVLANPWITDVKYIPTIISNSVWSFQDIKGISNHYRPLYLLYYMATYYIFEYKAWGYHLVNNLFHTVSSVFVFLIALKLLTQRITTGSEEIIKAATDKRHYIAALIAALIFATHPVNSESVVWIAAVSEVSFALFCLISIYLYITSPRFGSRRYWLSVFFFFVGALSKESSVFLPPLLLCYDLIVRREPVKPLMAWVKRFAPFIIAGLVYLTIRSLSLGGITPMPPGESELSTGSILINLFPLVGAYLYKLILPINLIFYENFIVPTGPGDLRVIATVIAIAAIVYMAFRIRSEKGALFSLLWIFIPLLPVFHVSLVKGSPTLAERYLYISTAGFGMLIMFGYLKFREKFSDRSSQIVTAIIFILIAAYSVGTYKRTLIWRNELILWEDTVRKDPTNYAANNNLAIELNRLGRLDDSITHFKRSLEIKPSHHPARNNLGVALAMKGDLVSAEAHFREVLDKDPLNPDAKKNLKKVLLLKQER